MNNLLQKIIDLIDTLFSTRSLSEEYLAQSIDHADLKARECKLKYGGYM